MMLQTIMKTFTCALMLNLVNCDESGQAHCTGNAIDEVKCQDNVRDQTALLQSSLSVKRQAKSKLDTSAMASLPSSLQKLGKKLLGDDADDIISKAKTTEIIIGKLTFNIRSAADDAGANGFQEFVTDPYGIKRLKGISSGTVIDIGGNLGVFTIGAALTNPNLQILACEPMPVTYFFLKWNLLVNHIPEVNESEFHSGMPGVLALRRAVTKDGRNVQAEYDPNWSQQGMTSASTSKSHLPAIVPNPGEPNATHQQLLVVPGLSVPEFFQSVSYTHNSDPDIVFLKIDCEGCEHEVVPDLLATVFLSNVRMGAAEVHGCLTFTQWCDKKDLVQRTTDTLRKHGNFTIKEYGV
jgi:FkbM family methyltransferase